MATPCIWKENYELMKQIRDLSITYCTFTETRGSGLGDFADALINKSIALLVKLKANRDYVDEAIQRPVKSEQEEIKFAESILAGTAQEDRLDSVIKRLYC